jgi:hypothetical protein
VCAATGANCFSQCTQCCNYSALRATQDKDSLPITKMTDFDHVPACTCSVWTSVWTGGSVAAASYTVLCRSRELGLSDAVALLPETAEQARANHALASADFARRRERPGCQRTREAILSEDIFAARRRTQDGKALPARRAVLNGGVAKVDGRSSGTAKHGRLLAAAAARRRGA